MNFIDAVLHLLNFCAPAGVVALLICVAGRFLSKKRPVPGIFIQQFAIHFIVCLGVLLVGLILTGRDGKMYTYLAMVLASGSVQWWLGQKGK
jgi:hypothetical protein